MAGLTRKALAAMGVEEEKADEIIKLHTDVTTELKDERDKYRMQAEKLDAVQKQLDEALEAAKQGDRSPYKAKYEALLTEKDALKKEYDDFKADQEAKAVMTAKKEAYRKMLLDAGVSEKRIESVLRLAEVDGKVEKLEINDGNVEDSDAIKKDIAESYDEYIVTKDTQGADISNPPSNIGGQQGGASEATLRAQRYYANLYGEAKEA